MIQVWDLVSGSRFSIRLMGSRFGLGLGLKDMGLGLGFGIWVWT